ncbi:MAG: ParA family protein [Hyphomicrobiaceae bacterium]|nr:ParA family protein [Hyphomicrobiaceae bacterium]
MAYFLAVANRKGGVGKSTLSVMLAHAFAVWGKKRVLMLDLDSQCNASLILIGGQGWSDARKAQKTIADYFYDLFDGVPAQPRDYLLPNVGDVHDGSGRAARINLLPGSLLLEDIQGELFLKQSRESNSPDVVASRVRGRIETLLRRFGASYDLVILDCAPGLSLAALAALKTADKVLVPFRPDYVSQLAVDRIALLIEDKGHLDALADVPFDERRYTTIANGVRNTGKDRIMIDDIGAFHPMLETTMPHKDAIANAFDWEPGLKNLGEKYGDGTRDLEKLYSEVAPWLEAHGAARAAS